MVSARLGVGRGCLAVALLLALLAASPPLASAQIWRAQNRRAQTRSWDFSGLKDKLEVVNKAVSDPAFAAFAPGIQRPIAQAAVRCCHCALA